MPARSSAAVRRALELPALVTAVAFWCAAAAPAQNEPLCGDCKGTGKLARPPSAAEVRQEEGTKFCSIFMTQHPETLGLDWSVCAGCRTPSVKARAEAEFAMEFARREAWLDECRADVDAHAGKEVAHLETAHFRIAWDIPRMKVKRRMLQTHELIHLYAARMEQLYADLVELHGLGPRGIPVEVRLFLFESAAVAKRVGDRVVDGIGGTAAKSGYGPVSRHVRHWDQERIATDEQFHQVLAHSVSHLLHDRMGDGENWLFDRYGWVHEGLAHYVEIRNFGVPNTSCGREASVYDSWKGKSWESIVRKAVLAGEEPPFQDVIQRSTDTISLAERRFAWSYIDYLMWLDPKKMPRFLGLLKGPQLPTREALDRVYGLTMGQFIDGWRAFVKREYSAKDAAGPRVREPRAESGGDPKPERPER